MAADFNPADLLDTIERGYLLHVPSRPLFGAMSFALEETFLRSAANAPVRERARALSATVRAAFIERHAAGQNSRGLRTGKRRAGRIAPAGSHT